MTRIVRLGVVVAILCPSSAYAAYSCSAVVVQGSTNGNTFTTTAASTSGADLLVAALSDYAQVSASTFSDSQSNTWSIRTAYTNPGLNERIRLAYVQAPSTSASHTFTMTGTGVFSSVSVAQCTGSVPTPFDVENGGGNDSTATIQPGSITPGSNNEVVFTDVAFNTGDTLTLSGYTITGQTTQVGGQHFGVGLAYNIQTTATATNPTWTGSTSSGMAASIASFKASGGGGTPGCKNGLLLLGAGCDE